jgi:Calx-beta domain
MNRRFPLPLPFVLGILLTVSTAFAADPTNPILFVTQVPMPEEVNTRTITSNYMSCVSPFGSHLGGTAFAGRGGSLWVRFPANATPALNHQVVDLLAAADWSAIPGGKPAANTVAARNPCVYWDKSKAVFSMVVGAPSGPNDITSFVWQLYEITLPTQAQLNSNAKPVLTKVPNQPDYNNVMPCYAPDGQFIFASDRPYNGQAHLTQREEYLGLPTVSGLWKLNAATTTLQLLHHSPSGAFSPTVDSAGRLIFVNWDHLSRDIEAVTDERDSETAYGEPDPDTFGGWHATGNGSGNFADESAGAAFTLGSAYGQGPHLDFFPEPRNADKKTLTLEWNNTINGVTTNIFLPWMINVDGTGGEILNHVGRHEVAGGLKRSFTTDNNLVDLNPSVAPGYGGLVAHNFFNNLMWVREDPLHPGTFYGTDSVDLGTHGSGQIIKLTNAGANVNPDTMQVSYVTASVTGAAKPQNIPIVRVGMNITQPPSPFTPLTTPETLYRTPIPLADGALVASTATGIDQTDWNRGTASQPSTPFNFRLKSLKLQGGSFVPDVILTNGLIITTSYYIAGQGQPVTFTNVVAWELDPAEIVARTAPIAAGSVVDPIEAGVFAANGVDIPTFQSYLMQQNAALSVSRNVTKRDLHDRQQPYNLKISWSNTQTTAPSPNNSPIYNVGWIQFLQADLRRGYLLGGATPSAGRRVAATPLHDTMSENVATPGAPPGSVRLGDDGSFAAIVPAGKALTWHLLDNDVAKTSQVKERFWVTFRKGEIRSCANCHGINTSDQSGTVANPVPRPTNPPQALAALLQSWKTNHPPGTMQHANSTMSAPKNSGLANLSVTRTGGSTGPVGVNFATADGTALAGTDFAFASGTLSWLDGDSSSRTITVTLLNNPVVAPNKSLTVNLTNPLNGSLGAPATATLTLTEPVSNATPTPTATPTTTATPTSTATPTPAPTVSPSPKPAQFGNISSRVSVGTGANVLIGGFIVTGTQPKKIIVRGIGPSLSVPGALADPILELHDSLGQTLATNDDWGNSANKQEIIDSTVAPTHAKEATILMTLPPGGYTAIVSGVNGGTGVALVEVYDLDTSADSKLANISTRALVQTDDNVLIGGFIVLGQQSGNVIVRAMGPSLGVPGALADPTLELHDGNGSQLAANDNWRTDQQTEIISSTIPPGNDAESAIVATLAPGPYTAIVRGANNATGIGLVEVYQLQ